MEKSYRILGGRVLRGKVSLSGAKNVALKVLIASLLFNDQITFENIPLIGDVMGLIRLLNDLGVRTEILDNHKLNINPGSFKKNKVDLFFGSKIRVSFLFFGPLIRRFGECYIPNPGGCRIGARPIDRVIEGMRNLGLSIEYDSSTGYYFAKKNKKVGGYYCFPKPTHTGTEALILLAGINDREIILDNCALEPEVDQLIKLLNQAGAEIKRQKNKKRISINPVRNFKSPKSFRIMTDRNELVTFSCLVLASGGEVVFDGVNPNDVDQFLLKIKEIGAGVDILDQSIKLYSKGKLKASKVITGPHPGFMTDWQPNWAVLMTQAYGKSLIVERVFENRFAYVEQMKKFGAKIDFVSFKVKNPDNFFLFNYDKNKKYNQAVEIFGPQKLHGAVAQVTDLRAGATLAITALIANGESIIEGVDILERGYERFDEKVRRLGGFIEFI